MAGVGLSTSKAGVWLPPLEGRDSKAAAAWPDCFAPMHLRSTIFPALSARCNHRVWSPRNVCTVLVSE
jgi:hypothetical protein